MKIAREPPPLQIFDTCSPRPGHCVAPPKAVTRAPEPADRGERAMRAARLDRKIFAKSTSKCISAVDNAMTRA
jgi:hypothetical protein